MVARLQAAVGPDYEVATQAELTEETSNDFGEIVSIFNNVLLAFALITLFVAAFLVMARIVAASSASIRVKPSCPGVRLIG